MMTKNVQVSTLCKIVIKINLEERKRPAVVTQTDTCLTIFIVKETDATEGRLEWKCVDGQQPSEQMNDNTEVNCTDLISCRSVSDSGIIQVKLPHGNNSNIIILNFLMFILGSKKMSIAVKTKRGMRKLRANSNNHKTQHCIYTGHSQISQV